MAKVAPLKILILIVSSNRAGYAREILNNMGASASWSFLGRGIGRVKFLDILGFDNPEKTVFISMVPTKTSTKILGALCKDLELYKRSNGMAFTIPLSAISRDALNGFLEVQKQNELELKQQQEMQKQKELELQQEMENKQESKEAEK